MLQTKKHQAFDPSSRMQDDKRASRGAARRDRHEDGELPREDKMRIKRHLVHSRLRRLLRGEADGWEELED